MGNDDLARFPSRVCMIENRIELDRPPGFDDMLFVR